MNSTGSSPAGREEETGSPADRRGRGPRCLQRCPGRRRRPGTCLLRRGPGPASPCRRRRSRPFSPASCLRARDLRASLARCGRLDPARPGRELMPGTTSSSMSSPPSAVSMSRGSAPSAALECGAPPWPGEGEDLADRRLCSARNARLTRAGPKRAPRRPKSGALRIAARVEIDEEAPGEARSLIPRRESRALLCEWARPSLGEVDRVRDARPGAC